MARKKRPSRRTGTAPTPDQSRSPVPRRRRITRWRVFSLSMVYLVFAAHIIHWKVTGRTLAPLELNEVMYTLELGIITAGFLFMCFLVLGTLVFGRFFCSWACHIMVLQELCAWVLRKLGIRRKPLRSRLLLLVPPLTALYMFIWPQILRAWESQAFPEFHFRSDSEGWASFVTANFWRNLPSAPIIVLTFLVCGFLIVYLLGSRTFCTYVCPYGAVFSLADRFAPGRLRSNSNCKQCGTCTSTCTSGIRVHEELKTHGMVVNSSCMKCLDCVEACPHDALHYGFTTPSIVRAPRGAGRFGKLPYDFTLREEALMAVVFLVTTLSLRGLYGRIPFLLSLALGGIVAFLTVTALQLATRPNVLLGTLPLRRQSSMTPWGRVYAASFAALAIFVVHCSFVRFHEYTGLRQALAMGSAASPAEREQTAAGAYEHLRTADRWGLMANERVQHSLLDVALHLGKYDAVEACARNLLARQPDDGVARLQFGQALAAQGQIAPAEREFRTITQWNPENPSAPHVVAAAHEALGNLFARQRRFEAADAELRNALKHNPDLVSAQAGLGSVLAELGRLEEAIECLRRVVQLDPKLAYARYNLGTLLSQAGHLQEAIDVFEAAAEEMPPDSDLHNNLGMVLLQAGNADRALAEFETAIKLDPGNANAHFNLGRLFAHREDAAKAVEQYRIAARLDARYASLLSE